MIDLPLRARTTHNAVVEPRKVLRDPAADRRLKRDGFVKLALFDRDEAARLRERVVALRSSTTVDEIEETGFCSDFASPDLAYRARSNELLSEALDGPVQRLFEAHRPFLRSVLAKYPGPDSDVHLHQDWMYVDERNGGRTYAVWVALEDVLGDNGQLRVLRGSHLIPGSLRGSDLITDWLSFQDVIEPRLLSVPVAAGECVVFDNAVVHSSYPNHTDGVRYAAAVDLRHQSDDLVYFRRSGGQTADRYDIDESFFLTEVPQYLLFNAPELTPVESIELADVGIDADSLVSLLDRSPLARIDRVQHVAAMAGQRAGSSVATMTAAAADRAARWRDARPSADQLRQKAREGLESIPSRAAMLVLGANEAMIDRFGPEQPAVWDPSQFEWARRVEAGYPDVRAEVEALLAGPTDIPHIEDVTGGIPQGNIGPWRSFVLMHQGRWIDWNCERCPRTTALARSIPGLSMVGFSVLEPGTHITEHRGPNKGALRYQLGVIVPGEYGDCRIRVGNEMLRWVEGEGVMFDFTVPHEAWNDSDAIRVLLMLEVATPLPRLLAYPNRLAQRAMAWFPTTRDITRRLRALEPTLVRGTPSGPTP